MFKIASSKVIKIESIERVPVFEREVSGLPILSELFHPLLLDRAQARCLKLLNVGKDKICVFYILPSYVSQVLLLQA